MNKLAILTLGWHYPEYFYQQLPKQKVPEGWEIDYFCISHRDPKFAEGEKKVEKTDNIFKNLDYFFYNKTATVESIKSYGWGYIEKPNIYGDWSQFNQWAEDYDYKNYDLFMITGDDNLFLNDDLFVDILGNKMQKIIDNGKINGKHSPKLVDYSYDDWWVISNSVHMGRGVLRGSMEFIKKEMFDIIGGRFDLEGKERKNNSITPKEYLFLDQIGWNKQVYPFMITLEENNLYSKVRFLSSHYRASDYCIEGERGIMANNNCSTYAGYYKTKVLELYKQGKLNKFL